MSALEPAPYRDLGRFLRMRREEVAVSALEFWRQHQAEWGIVYGRFAAIERGESLPEPALLVKIARALGVPERVALLHWASCQMSTSENREFFLDFLPQVRASLDAHGNPIQKQYEIRSHSIPPSEFDNTWVLSPQDLETLDAYIELFDLLVLLEVSWPEAQTYAQLGFSGYAQWSRFRATHLERWFREGRLEESSGQVRLCLPHFHLPKTDLWLPFRKRIVERFVASALPQMTPEALAAKEAFRTFTTRVLSPRQVQALTERLPAIEKEFFETPLDVEVSREQRRSYSLLVLLAKRDLQTAAHLTQERQKGQKKRKSSRS